LKIVDQVLAHRRTQKLKQARALAASDLETLKHEIVAAGGAALHGLFECLGHPDARPHAIDVLGRVLTNDTLSHYLDALAFPDAAIVSGVAEVLGRDPQYDVSRLLDLLEQGRVPKSVLESLLTRQAARIPLDRALFVLPALPRESQVLLFRFF
jgi:hypothetical protein